MRRFLFDTSVFLYALGGEHHYREPCRAILREMREGLLTGEASVELVHEFAYVRCRRTGTRVDAAEPELVLGPQHGDAIGFVMRSESLDFKSRPTDPGRAVRVVCQ